MKTLIVHESMFGNTKRVANAIAKGLLRGRPGEESATVEVLTTDEAPGVIPPEVSLLVCGGPTHAFGMTRESTRSDAANKGATEQVRSGLREWVEKVAPLPDLPVVTFDTRIKVRFLPGSAAKAAAQALRERGFRRASRGETFWVEDTGGPLKPGELERAEEWGAELATKVGHAPAI